MKNVKLFGIKGFDENLKCRDHQYEIGKFYELDERPKLCTKGFHYSKTIDDAKKYYKEKNNRFCIVEILGEIDEGVDKCCTNKIMVVRELKQQDIIEKLCYERLEQLCDIGYIIGGSAALRIYGYKIDREFNEVDLIVNNKQDHAKNFNGFKQINRTSGIDSIICYVGIFSEKYDILLWKTSDKIPFNSINVNGCELKLMDENIIWEQKLKYALKGSIKHMVDIRNNGIRFQKVISKKKKIDNYFSEEDLLF